jgi:hypothetical protein
VAAKGAAVFQNRISGFDMTPGGEQQHRAFGLPAARNELASRRPPQFVHQVALADIYQAAMQRALHDHQLDKLFNPEYYDFQI